MKFIIIFACTIFILANPVSGNEKIWDIVMNFEGGYNEFPSHSGGKTMLGITQATLNKAYNQEIVKHKNICSLTKEETITLYKKLYWNPSKAHLLPWPLNLLHFDAAIHHGINGSAVILQQAINIASKTHVKVDGGIGQETIIALMEIMQNEEQVYKFCLVLLEQRSKRFNEIVSKNKAKKKYLNSWNSRVFKLQELLENENKIGGINKWQ